ncbi:sensor histidine kinase [Jannaschia aquimarina]|uniref:histidine kinase n=1 Tax=Jannaschia aquimarina TaxID=935700 RepID=A0A0D1DC76_9RHOB|nr:HAMP domain-containing sensor histidine kinase [Jannaschia aquimarina]KIT17603.1 Phytochrome-like protein cph1 [Jannaschia aquimarina]SNS71638.1 Signal transduction histidine kinase [Jannaschia aquimarina]
MLTSLSGRFLILTVIFVMLAEVLIFVPSIARYRLDYLTERLERAQIASLALLGADGMIPEEVELELLENAGVLNVVLRRDAARQLVLSSDLPRPISKTVDLRDPSPVTLITDALTRFFMPGGDIIRVIGEPAQGGGLQIEAALDTQPLHRAMLEYGLNILILSAVISAITAAFLFLAVRRLMVQPIKSLVGFMMRYAAAPEDARRIIEPRSRIRELHEAETALRDLQTELSTALRQKERLAQLGGAVAKIAHDLRNILTTTTLLSDRLESVEDPTVQRVAPKLVASLTRAVNLTEGTLAFGRAEEAPPRLEYLPALPFLNEICETEQLSVADGGIRIEADVPAAMALRADREQMHRVVGNLIRNARQAIQAAGAVGTIRVHASETPETWVICVEDDGPGLPPKARENLFEAFKGTVRKGGTGLGLAIAAELVRGHGGTIALERSDETGTVFRIELPRGSVG